MDSVYWATEQLFSLTGDDNTRVPRPINMRILHSGSKAPRQRDFRKHGLQDPSVYVFFGSH